MSRNNDRYGRDDSDRTLRATPVDGTQAILSVPRVAEPPRVDDRFGADTGDRRFRNPGNFAGVAPAAPGGAMAAALGIPVRDPGPHAAPWGTPAGMTPGMVVGVGTDNPRPPALIEGGTELPDPYYDPAEDLPEPDEEVRQALGDDYDVARLLQASKEAAGVGKAFMDGYRAAWQRSIKATRNEHFEGSKYLTPRFRARSKIFKPKTLSALRKSLASSASALFSTPDAITITAPDQTNRLQVASAAVKQELVNHRLDSANGRSGIPWFLISSGAYHDAQTLAICVSKQVWIYEERVLRPGEYERMLVKASVTRRQDGTLVEIVRDRPEIVLAPPENVIIDPSAPWTNPASGEFFQCEWPMSVQALLGLMKEDGAEAPYWLDVEESELLAYAGGSDDTIKGARAGEGKQSGGDRQGRFRTVRPRECFLRIDGEDWCYWTLGNQLLLSVPRPTRDVYPAYFGDRPYVVGLGAVQPHRVIPMSNVESWQQLQQEVNDLTNYRLDQAKMAVNPPWKALKGRVTDVDTMQSMAADRVIYVQKMDDIEPLRSPDVPASAYQETNLITNDLDELSGQFSGASVASTRQLGETVGGMRMLSGAASAITEFDLKVWLETWTTPVLSQIVRLESMYENDRKILEIAGEKAQLYQRFGMDGITDHMLMEDATVRINVGLGAGDPMQSMAKMAQGFEVIGKVLMPLMQAGMVPQFKVKPVDLIDEVMGKAGIRDGFNRFFEGGTGPSQAEMAQQQAAEQAAQGAGPSPEQVKLEQEKMKLAGKQADNETKKEIAQLNVADRQAERQNRMSLESMKMRLGMHQKDRDHSHAYGMQQDQQHHDMTLNRAQRIAELARGAREQRHAAGMEERRNGFQMQLENSRKQEPARAAA